MNPDLCRDNPVAPVTKSSSRALIFASLIFVICPFSTAAGQDAWFDRKTEWNGYERFHFHINGRQAYVVAPRDAAAGKPWVWRARFPDYHAEMDIALLGKGLHVAHVDVSGLFGCPEAVEVGNAFYDYLTKTHAFSTKPALEGVSRGGLFVYNWAASNPDRVACIYCDTPVCDFKSWPGGKGRGIGSARDWARCLQAYGLTEDEALTYRKNPLDHAAVIADAGIPVMHIVSENDEVVPPKENSYLLKDAFEASGHAMLIISVAEGTERSHGHHFDHPAIERVVRFIERHTGSQSGSLDLLKQSERIVFLGDSITYAGHYVALFDAWLSTQDLETHPIVINVGLPSETVSGLSEAGHAGGRFPRPDLAERLDRVLATTNPDLVIACYGINCGIYQPLDDERFQKYKSGVLHLKQKVEDAGATLILVTPPFFDDLRARKPFSYNEVMANYSRWLTAQRDQGWLVADLHSAMSAEVARRRTLNPDFTFQPDSVHPNAAGHWFVARRLIEWFAGRPVPAETEQRMLADRGVSASAFALIEQRANLRRDAYLSAAGHKRPGINSGLPVAEAERSAQELSERLRPMLQPLKP